MMERPSEESVSIMFEKSLRDRSFRLSQKETEHYVDEFDGLSGRADFVISPTDLNSIPQNIIERFVRGISTPASASIVGLLIQGKQSIKEIVERLCLSRNTVTKCIKKLEAERIAVRNDDDTVEILDSFVVPSIELWAIELKVENWRRAIYQSLQYRSFSHITVIVIPMMYSKRILAHRDQFQTFNIGVIALDLTNGSMRTIIRAAKDDPSDNDQHLYAKSVFLRRLHPEINL